METASVPGRLGRRRLLAQGSALLAGGLVAASPLSSLAAINPAPLPVARPALLLPPTRRVNLFQVNTDEKLDVVYQADGRADSGALDAVNHLMRDWHTGDVIEIDTRLLDLLCALQRFVAEGRPIEVISAYRTKKTNDWLRRQGRNAAKHSLHIEGKAVDLRIPGVRLHTIRAAAYALEMGGVGYYPHSGFVNVDTGPVRYW